MSTPHTLFISAEMLYQHGKVEDAFVIYQKCIKKILTEGIPTTLMPDDGSTWAIWVPDNYPRETLGLAWISFLAILRDPALTLTAESHPEAFKLLNSFRPGASSKLHARLERTARGKILLKGMQVTAGLTLGLLAWDKRDRATASKRYKEVIDLAQTHPPFVTLDPGASDYEKYIYSEVQQTKDNLEVLVQNDTANALLSASTSMDGHLPGRREVVELPPFGGVDKTGQVNIGKTWVFATDACAKCAKRDVKLMRCQGCRKVTYCGAECQKADWKIHKTACIQKK